MTVCTEMGRSIVACRNAARWNMTTARVKPQRARRFCQYRLTGKKQNNHQGDELGVPSHTYSGEYRCSKARGL